MGRIAIGCAAGLMALAGLCGCNRRTRATIVLDDQWSIKQARADCQSRQGEGVPPCTGDPAVQIRDLESQTVGALQVTPECGGMTLLTLHSSANPSLLNSTHTWWIFPELLRSNAPEELRYTVANVQNPNAPGSAHGQGPPSSVAHEICSFVQQGGTME